MTKVPCQHCSEGYYIPTYFWQNNKKSEIAGFECNTCGINISEEQFHVEEIKAISCNRCEGGNGTVTCDGCQDVVNLQLSE